MANTLLAMCKPYHTIQSNTKPYHSAALWQFSMGHSLLTASRPNTFIGRIRQMDGISAPSSFKENIARIANAVTITLYSKVIVHIVVLNCRKCNQCLKCQVSGHKNFQQISKLSKNLKNFQKSEFFSKI